MEAGADATLVEAPRSEEELREIGEKVKGLKVCNMLEGGITPLHTPEELRALGFQVTVYPLSGLFSSTRALLNVYGNLNHSGKQYSTIAAGSFENRGSLVARVTCHLIHAHQMHQTAWSSVSLRQVLGTQDLHCTKLV